VARRVVVSKVEDEQEDAVEDDGVIQEEDLASSSGFLFARLPLPLQLGQNSRLAKDF
jgi:hypothetical protein